MPETPSAPRARRGNAVVTPIPAAAALPHAAPDFEQAARFLMLLDESAERWTFQTFDDTKARQDPALARVLHGTLRYVQDTCKKLSSGL